MVAESSDNRRDDAPRARQMPTATHWADIAPGELAGTWAARRGVYRILYEIHDEPEEGHLAGAESGSIDRGVVLVVDVAHRGQIYRRR